MKGVADVADVDFCRSDTASGVAVVEVFVYVYVFTAIVFGVQYGGPSLWFGVLNMGRGGMEHPSMVASPSSSLFNLVWEEFVFLYGYGGSFWFKFVQECFEGVP